VLPGTSLPESVDFSNVRGPIPLGVDAQAIIQYNDRSLLDADTAASGGVVVLGDDGIVYSLDITSLYASPDAIRDAPVYAESLSPDGTHVFFVVDRDTLTVYDFQSGAWATIHTGAHARAATWSEDSRTIRVPHAGFEPSFALFQPDGMPAGTSTDVPLAPKPPGNASPCGPVRTDEVAAQHYSLNGFSPRLQQFIGELPDGAVDMASGDVDSLVVGPRGDSPGEVLGVRDPVPACALVVGWVDPDTVAYLSTQAGGVTRVLAWRIGTPDVWRVSDLEGLPTTPFGWVGSFAAPRD
jgi:hypothetical protein